MNLHSLLDYLQIHLDPSVVDLRGEITNGKTKH